jgi:hypothetical protein
LATATCDIEAGVDAAVKAAPIDPNRTGITGWIRRLHDDVGRDATTRFYGGRAPASPTGRATMVRTESTPDAAVLRRPVTTAGGVLRSSPITFIKKVKTPTLVLHGDRDSEVPTPQGYESGTR